MELWFLILYFCWYLQENMYFSCKYQQKYKIQNHNSNKTHKPYKGNFTFFHAYPRSFNIRKQLSFHWLPPKITYYSYACTFMKDFLPFLTTTPSPAKTSLSNFAAISDTFSPATEAPPCATTLLASDLVAARPAA